MAVASGFASYAGAPGFVGKLRRGKPGFAALRRGMEVVMAWIGGYEVWRLEGEVQLPGYYTRDEYRDAVDGQDTILLGVRGDQFRLGIDTDCLLAVYRANLVVNLANLQGSQVQVVDNHGETWNNLRVDGFKVLEQKNCLGSSGGFGGLFRLRAEFLMKNMSTSF